MALKLKKRLSLNRTVATDKLPQRNFKREQRRETAHRTTITVLVLTVLSIGVGIAYTWYQGENKTVASEAPPVRKTRPVFKAPKIASDARVGVAMQTYTPEVKPGENASATVRTNPEAICTIAVKYTTVPAVDSGLVQKAADEYGVVSWAWTVTAAAPSGKAPITVSCHNKKHSAVVASDMIVKK